MRAVTIINAIVNINVIVIFAVFCHVKSNVLWSLSYGPFESPTKLCGFSNETHCQANGCAWLAWSEKPNLYGLAIQAMLNGMTFPIKLRCDLALHVGHTNSQTTLNDEVTAFIQGNITWGMEFEFWLHLMNGEYACHAVVQCRIIVQNPVDSCIPCSAFLQILWFLDHSSNRCLHKHQIYAWFLLNCDFFGESPIGTSSIKKVFWTVWNMTFQSNDSTAVIPHTTIRQFLHPSRMVQMQFTLGDILILVHEFSYYVFVWPCGSVWASTSLFFLKTKKMLTYGMWYRSYRQVFTFYVWVTTQYRMPGNHAITLFFLEDEEDA